jgi:hypothetical protein
MLLKYTPPEAPGANCPPDTPALVQDGIGAWLKQSAGAGAKQLVDWSSGDPSVSKDELPTVIGAAQAAEPLPQFCVVLSVLRLWLHHQHADHASRFVSR